MKFNDILTENHPNFSFLADLSQDDAAAENVGGIDVSDTESDESVTVAGSGVDESPESEESDELPQGDEPEDSESDESVENQLPQ